MNISSEEPESDIGCKYKFLRWKVFNISNISFCWS